MSDLENLENMIEELDDLKGRLTDNDQQFADNLIHGKYGYYARGYLSGKQARWIPVLLDRAKGKGREQSKCEVDLTPVKTFLLNAKRTLKFPKVWLRTEDGRDLKVYVSGDRSKVPNAVNFVLYSQPENGWREDTWLGRVLDNGDWHRPFSTKDEDVAQVTPLLQGLAEAPGDTAAAFGKLTGRCCFCNRALSDQDKSTKVGYGPTCARKYNLYDHWKRGA